MGSGSKSVANGEESVGREFCLNVIRDVACCANRDDRSTKLRQCAAYKTLQRLVAELLENNSVSFNQMINQLGAQSLQGCEWRKSFYGIADSMLADGELNWGRIVALFAFTGHVAKRCYDRDGGTKEQVEEVAKYLADYVNENLSERIQINLGGWDSITERFPEQQSVESLVWKGLLGTVVSLGICSLAIIATK